MNEAPPSRPFAHGLDDAHQHRGLPVALGAEAVAVGHQPLGTDARQLLEAAQVLEGVDEGHRAEPVEEGAQAQLDARGVTQRLAPLAVRAQLGHDVVELVVLGAEPVDVGVGHLVDHRRELVDGVGVAGGAEAGLDLDLVAVGVGHLAHVVAEADALEVAGLVHPGGGPHPGADAALD